MYKSLIIAASVAVAVLAAPAGAKVASDPALLGLTSPPFPAGGPGNSAAAKNGGDPSCLGKFVSANNNAGGNDTPGGPPIEGISIVFTLGGVIVPLVGGDCSQFIAP